MPPLPKGSRRPSTGKRERDTGGASSSAPGSTGVRSRTTKAETLQSQVARMYLMVGTMIRPFGRFYPVLAPIGDNLKELSDDAAQAWMDLAQKDKRVLEMLETLTGASVWGNVIGIHFAIFGSALAQNNEYLREVMTEPDNPGTTMRDEFYKQGRAVGLSDEEIEVAIAQAMGTPIPVRDMDTGGPGDTIRTGGQPTSSTATAAPPVAKSKSAIATPEQLGVTQTGEDGMFPHDSEPPNGSGSIQ